VQFLQATKVPKYRWLLSEVTLTNLTAAAVSRFLSPRTRRKYAVDVGISQGISDISTSPTVFGVINQQKPILGTPGCSERDMCLGWKQAKSEGKVVQVAK